MALDGIVIYKILNDMQNELPIKINQIYGLSAQEIILQVRAQKNNKQIIISTHPNLNRIHYTDSNYGNFSHPNNFIMMLRKHLNNGYIIDIKQQEMDRYFVFYIESYNDIGDLIDYQLHIELMGRYANLVLVQNGKIIDAIKRISPIENATRPMVPGANYQAPLMQNKKILITEDKPPKSREFHKIYSGVSFLLNKEINYRLDQGEDFKNIIQEIKQSNSLWLSHPTENGTLDYHVIKLKHLKRTGEFHKIHHAFDYLYHQKSTQERINDVTGSIKKIISRNIKRVNRRIKNLEKELLKADNAEQYRTYGDLLLTYPHKVKKGMGFVNLNDFSGNLITIPLNPLKDGIENSQEHYKKYKKLKRSIDFVVPQIESAENELYKLKSIQEQLDIADIDSALEIKEELEDLGYIKKTSKKTAKRTKPKYQSILYQGKQIIFGKNSKQNDYITFKIAKKNHYWFHAQNYHGAHVVILDENPKRVHMEFAAMIAAYYSNARNLQKAAVNYCQIKELKRPRQGHSGQVLMQSFDTIFVNIDIEALSTHIKDL